MTVYERGRIIVAKIISVVFVYSVSLLIILNSSLERVSLDKRLGLIFAIVLLAGIAEAYFNIRGRGFSAKSWWEDHIAVVLSVPLCLYLIADLSFNEEVYFDHEMRVDIETFSREYAKDHYLNPLKYMEVVNSRFWVRTYSYLAIPCLTFVFQLFAESTFRESPKPTPEDQPTSEFVRPKGYTWGGSRRNAKR